MRRHRADLEEETCFAVDVYVDLCVSRYLAPLTRAHLLGFTRKSVVDAVRHRHGDICKTSTGPLDDVARWIPLFSRRPRN